MLINKKSFNIIKICKKLQQWKTHLKQIIKKRKINKLIYKKLLNLIKTKEKNQF